MDAIHSCEPMSAEEMESYPSVAPRGVHHQPDEQIAALVEADQQAAANRILNAYPVRPAARHIDAAEPQSFNKWPRRSAPETTTSMPETRTPKRNPRDSEDLRRRWAAMGRKPQTTTVPAKSLPSKTTSVAEVPAALKLSRAELADESAPPPADTANPGGQPRRTVPTPRAPPLVSYGVPVAPYLDTAGADLHKANSLAVLDASPEAFWNSAASSLRQGQMAHLLGVQYQAPMTGGIPVQAYGHPSMNPERSHHIDMLRYHSAEVLQHRPSISPGELQSELHKISKHPYLGTPVSY